RDARGAGVLGAAADGEAEGQAVGGPEIAGPFGRPVEFGAGLDGVGGVGIFAVEEGEAAEEYPVLADAAGDAGFESVDGLIAVERGNAVGVGGDADVGALAAEDGEGGGQLAIEEIPLRAELVVVGFLGFGVGRVLADGAGRGVVAGAVVVGEIA